MEHIQRPKSIAETTVADMVERLRRVPEPQYSTVVHNGELRDWAFARSLIEQFDAKGRLSPKQEKCLRKLWLPFWRRDWKVYEERTLWS